MGVFFVASINDLGFRSTMVIKSLEKRSSAFYLNLPRGIKDRLLVFDEILQRFYFPK